MADNTSTPAAQSTTPTLPRGLIARRGVPAGRGNRLPSIRTPRDLTLGGVPKKSFAPNIPARRKKEDAPTESKKPKQQREDTGGRGRGREPRGRGRGRGRGDVIQSHSIFEQGPAERTVKPGAFGSDRESSGGGRGGGGRGGGGGGGGVGGIGGGRLGGFKKEGGDESDTKKILDYILRDDFTVDENLGGDDPLMTPIRLPVGLKKETKTEDKPVLPIDKPGIVEVKEENGADGDVTMEDAAPAQPPGVNATTTVKTASSRVRTCADLFSSASKSENGELIFVQLPDVLPGNPPLKEPEPRDRDHNRQIPKPGQSATIDPLAPTEEEKAEEEKLAQRLSQCSLVDFNEGHIGKLRIHKSGRTTLLLGDVSLDVSMGTPAGFLQDLVSVKLDDDNGGDMMVLGHSNHKLVCSPDFETMLADR